MIKRVDGHKNDFENSCTTKVGEHIPCGYSMSTICAFDGMENKHDVCRGKDCMKKFSKSLRGKEEKDSINKRPAGIIWEDKNLLHLKKKQKKTVVHKYTNDKSYHKVRDHCHYTGK